MAALFGKKDDTEKTQETTPAAQEKQAAPATVRTETRSLESVILHPRITEKATMGTHERVYVFDVLPQTNKREVMRAVKEVYKVEPVKVNMVTVPSKNVRSMRTGIKGVKSGGKKAYVYLKEGDSISIM